MCLLFSYSPKERNIKRNVQGSWKVCQCKLVFVTLLLLISCANCTFISRLSTLSKQNHIIKGKT